MTKFEIYIREQSIAYREKVLKKSHPVLRNLSSKTLFFARVFENADYRTNSLKEVPGLPTEIAPSGARSENWGVGHNSGILHKS